jgi:hypothetical protein
MSFKYKPIRKNTPILDIIEEWKIEGIVNYLKTCYELGIYVHCEERFIAESLLVSYEEWEAIRISDNNLKKKKYLGQGNSEAFYDIKTMTSNLHDHIIEKKRNYFKGKRKQKQNKENGFHPPNWKGEKYIHSSGYVSVNKPDHPRANNSNRVKEHVLVAEKKLGRYLKDNEIVHHIDFDKQNNSAENLCVMNKLDHLMMHNSTLKRLFQEGKLIWKNGSYDLKS